MAEEATAAPAVAQTESPPAAPDSADATAVPEPSPAPKPTPVRESLTPPADRVSIRQAARQAAVDAGDTLAAKPAHHSRTQPRDVDGTFVPGEPGPPDEADTEEAAAEPADEPAAEVAAEATEAPGTVRLEVPQALRDGGTFQGVIGDHLDVPADQERFYRTLFNGYRRNQDVEAAAERAQQAEREAAKLKARIQAAESAEAKALDDPELQTLFEDMEAANYSPEVQQLVREGLKARRERLFQDAETEAVRATEMHGVAARFLDQVTADAPRYFPVWQQSGELAARLREAMVEYAALVDSTGADPDPQAFFRHATTRYMADPRAQEHVRGIQAQQEQDRLAKLRAELTAQITEQVRTELTEQFKKDAADARDRRRTNPLGRLPALPTGARSTSAAPDTDEGTESLDVGALRRRLREDAVETGRAFGGAT